jgi:hypothetical protein
MGPPQTPHAGVGLGVGAGDNTGVGTGPGEQARELCQLMTVTDGWFGTIGPLRHPRPITIADLHLELEKEQEAVVRLSSAHSAGSAMKHEKAKRHAISL